MYGFNTFKINIGAHGGWREQQWIHSLIFFDKNATLITKILKTKLWYHKRQSWLSLSHTSSYRNSYRVMIRSCFTFWCGCSCTNHTYTYINHTIYNEIVISHCCITQRDRSCLISITVEKTPIWTNNWKHWDCCGSLLKLLAQ